MGSTSEVTDQDMFPLDCSPIHHVGNLLGYFLDHFWENWVTFIPTSGLTASMSHLSSQSTKFKLQLGLHRTISYCHLPNYLSLNVQNMIQFFD